MEGRERRGKKAGEKEKEGEKAEGVLVKGE